MPGTRWLSDDEQRVWRDFRAAVDMVRGHVDGQLQRDSGMPHTYYEVLAVLSEAPGRTLRMSELAERCRSSRSRLSHAVARLEDNGWVRRDNCATDKRGAFAILTEEGFAVLEVAARGHVVAVREALFDALTPEQVTVLGEISIAIRDKLTPRCAAALAEAEADPAGCPDAGKACAG
ncbi:DNA-binding MarR family transcriptional regulator [Amycolatopsis bartoniae]|uniref:MarR family transcriptional regulator n=1 Tax=Amycolatopsis bartoniae TaxID=941986 RepID=A0A8H9J0P4_9PSEU|nr:MarR family transcriptional regulator [Amycolatopsis bartoniae]MBB2936622.1 DNA-binding MarR family transcriptional regulator [Amycolatopsis bartoniae]TVT09792.1 MarR family transcriptional regulator [Amycolatopsis bartoniae]GHF67597.1 MarR family transcriptional regulator [Amycolatopsis bartoniae]